ncbi:MAG: hypothetical protein LBM67_02525 [Lentimicrobiaceae bacterium]|jgi:hypothetical protein|nr:hypothetical protein [Lentimicrobiaceae bacterium]
MRKITLISLIIFASFVLNGQMPVSSKKFIEKNLSENDKEKIELSVFDKMNFSKIWLENQNAVIGYIGEDYQRIYVYFISIIKDFRKENEYYIYGKSKVKSNVCDFQGKFRIIDAYKINDSEQDLLYEEALKQGDQEVADRFGKIKGFVLTEYLLFENPEQNGSGFFTGVIKSSFYIEKETLFFDDLDLGYSDNYSNNQFVGIWESYMSSIQKKCNWGTYRVPYAGDLDIGVAEFSPNPKYMKNGWDTYHQPYHQSETLKEKHGWWK